MVIELITDGEQISRVNLADFKSKSINGFAAIEVRRTDPLEKPLRVNVWIGDFPAMSNL